MLIKTHMGCNLSCVKTMVYAKMICLHVAKLLLVSVLILKLWNIVELSKYSIKQPQMSQNHYPL